MKKLKYLLLVLFASFVSLNIVKANEGVVYSPRECFGITFGIHNNHWHKAILQNGQYIADGDPIYTYPCTPANDPTLKTLTINGNNISISDKMQFETYDEVANIVAIPTYQHAITEYEKTKELNLGNNIINIKVTSAGGLIKNYELNIIRKKVLSQNNNIKSITINDKDYKFKNNKIENISISSLHNSLDIKAMPEDNTAKISIKGNKNIKSGDNTITIICTAENGDTQNYYITVHKTMLAADIIGTIIGLLILASPVIIIIVIVALKNKKKYINNSHYYKKYKKLR